MADKAIITRCENCNRRQEISNMVQNYRCSGCMTDFQIQTHDQIGSNRHRHTTNQVQSRNNVVWPRHKSTCPDLQQMGVSTYACPLYDARLVGVDGKRGNKRALICGVSYKKQKYRLRGSLVDVYKIKDLLTTYYSFPPNDIRVLTEEETDSRLWPTKKNIEDGMKWLVKDCRAGDSLVFYFSGHGLRQPEFSGDERDGFDETLCPVDFKTQGMIIDNDINAIIVKPLVAGVTLHAIVDACHSGTILDLPWVYDQNKNVWEDNSPPAQTYKGTNGGLAISFSACEDSQMAADTTAFTKKGMSGAMTYCFIHAIETNPYLTYIELVTKMHDAITQAYASRCFSSKLMDRILKRNFFQVPQLSSSEIFDVHTRRFTL